MTMYCVTLLTDFGLAQEFVGVMHGVILSIAPEARVVDLCHHVPPQDVEEAAAVLEASWRYFPPGTVHVCVVDPGVGTERAVLAAEAGGQRFVAPDNGLLTPVLDAADRLVRVTEPRYHLASMSRTFHGRDVFAPVGAHLARGASLEDLGPPMPASLAVRLDRPAPVAGEGRVEGLVVSVDRFGNLGTNIPESLVRDLLSGRPAKDLRTHVAGREIRGLSQSYADAPAGELLAVCASRGFIEIAANRAQARELLAVGRGTPVVLTLAG